MFEWFWQTVSSPQSPRLKEITTSFLPSTPHSQDSDEDSTEIKQLETPVKSKLCYSPECPKAPEKKKIEIPAHVFNKSEGSRFC